MSILREDQRAPTKLAQPQPQPLIFTPKPLQGAGFNWKPLEYMSQGWFTIYQHFRLLWIYIIGTFTGLPCKISENCQRLIHQTMQPSNSIAKFFKVRCLTNFITLATESLPKRFSLRQ
ncbi:hypothetical protein DC094_19215 [Pelagibaculum spongiae]|uniref:Uncharacterized protein n=1 Tax=Pelagibaculum spongiae TaxID=2080658 RepID=A0A2V1GQ91_9GAMM|nr:hypothetical protein DC094_19215 [Pelagibaculum spongiae]